jgi:hypothetical protein
LSSRRSQSYLFIRRVIKQTVVIIAAYHSGQLHPSDILLSRLTPYGEEIIGDNQRGFRLNGSTTDHIFCIRQILEKKWEYKGAVHQLFVDFKKAYDSVKRKVSL